MATLEKHRRIDFDRPAAEADPLLGTAPLFGSARGQMFGVLVADDATGKTVVLRAFSGQFNGRLEAPGWAPPLFSVPAFGRLMGPADRQINKLGRELATMSVDDPRRAATRARRRVLSRETQSRLHDLYQLPNQKGEVASLHRFFQDVQGPPTGAGDCCAPKLLAEAARRGLHPRGLAEFFFGAENLSSTRRHGLFYPPCEDKCAPILGWMLCGLKP